MSESGRAPSGSAFSHAEVFTSSYSRFRPEWGVPVATTVGLPSWWKGGLEVWPTVAPWSLLDVTDPEELRRRYRHALHRKTPKVLAELAEMREAYAPAALVLLCFEPAGQLCHRHILAGWLAEHLGEEVREL